MHIFNSYFINIVDKFLFFLSTHSITRQQITLVHWHISFLFAWRYFKAKKSTQAINIIAWISGLAIAVGTAAIILVMSVFNGFEGLVTSLYSDFYTDLRITPQQGKTFILSDTALQKLQNIQGITALSGVVEEKALLINGEAQTIIYLKGVSPTYTKVVAIKKHVIRGSFYTGTVDTPAIVIGAGIENAVGVDILQGLYPLTLYMPAKKKSMSFDAANGLYAANIRPSGTFLIQQEFDNQYAFTSVAFMQYMLDLKPNEYTAIELRCLPNQKVENIKNNIEALLGNRFKVQTRYQQNQTLYTVMQVEKWVIFAMLCLILGVAAFNMIGTLTMLVLEKQKDIQILKILGANNKQIQQIFLMEGMLIGFIGALIGAGIAITLCILQIYFKWIKLGGEAFIIDYYPVKMQATDFALVFTIIFIIVTAAAWLPARKAARLAIALKS